MLSDKASACCTFLYAWELGAAFGHIAQFAAYAEALMAQGHAVHFAVRETAQCARLLPAGSRWFQAPKIDEASRSTQPSSYADILLYHGYDDAGVLGGLLVAWREIITAVQPDLIIADHAPTAILVARLMGVRVMLFGNGFTLPPMQDPYPAMRHWQPVMRSRLARSSATALSSINTALSMLRGMPLKRLSDLFDVAETALMGTPELDHYAGRGPAQYWGPAGTFSGNTIAPGWTENGRPRIFGYLKPDHPHLATLLPALAARDDDILLSIPGWRAPACTGPRMRIVRELVDLDEVARSASLAIVCGSGTTIHLLTAGVPVLCLPMHLEGFLLGLRVAALGAGAVVNPEAVSLDATKVIDDLLSSARVKASAHAFAEKYAAFDQVTVVRNYTQRALTLARERPGEVADGQEIRQSI